MGGWGSYRRSNGWVGQSQLLFYDIFQNTCCSEKFLFQTITGSVPLNPNSLEATHSTKTIAHIRYSCCYVSSSIFPPLLLMTRLASFHNTFLGLSKILPTDKIWAWSENQARTVWEFKQTLPPLPLDV